MSSETKLIRSFGRIKSRKLSNHKQFLFDELLPKYQINLSNSAANPESFFDNKFTKINLEIGFGFGDFLFETAKNNPDIGFIGCETHINGIVNLLSKLEKEPLQNIKIAQFDVRILLEKLNNKSLNKIYILFPDPWPKVKHFKRRLINNSFLNLLAKKIANQSNILIATDHDSYKKWIISHILNNKHFWWNAKSKTDWQTPPDGWITTKYQKKAQKEGRVSVFLTLLSHNS